MLGFGDPPTDQEVGLYVRMKTNPKVCREAAWKEIERRRAEEMLNSTRHPAQKRALITKLSAMQNHRCCHCGKRTNEAKSRDDHPTIEHIIPWSRGGRNNLRNLAMTCRACNHARGNRIFWRPKK